MLASGSTQRPRLPTTGMRGGLGRTLLTAFLVLAIVPLITISWYATVRQRRDIQREVTAKLSSVATVMEVQVLQWAERRIGDLALLAALPATAEDVSALTTDCPAGASPARGIPAHNTDDIETAREALRIRLQAMLSQDPAFRCLAVLDNRGTMLVSVGPQTECALLEQVPVLEPGQDSGLRSVTLDHAADVGLVVAQRIAAEGNESVGTLAGRLSLSSLVADLQAVSGLGETGEIYLVDATGLGLPQGELVNSPGIEAALLGEDEEGLHENYAGVPVIGVYRWIPRLGLALVAEQAQEEAFETTENVTAAVVGATLIVALATAVIAAVVTRQMTRPIVLLTESALNIAAGDLKQSVPVTSRDEIGILAHVFNRMTADLKALYDDLEGKVAERTALLQRANYQIQRRAIQMQASLEVGQAVTSILDPDELLEQVVEVVRSRFVYSYAAVYTADEDGRQLHLRASAGDAVPFHGKAVSADMPGPVGQAFCERAPVVQTHVPAATVGRPASYTSSEVALPLRLGERTLGVLDVQSNVEEGFSEDDVSVLHSVAHQITIALDNARAYAIEREAAERLRELDRSKRRFLTHMSHELRTPLTNIIGFSRLMLKGFGGSLTEQQESDLHVIYQNGQHLLGLINDLLDVSQIEAGLMALEFRQVDLAELIHSVMATASALVRDKEVEVHQEIAPNLPAVQADQARIRQVLLRLLANAAKFTDQGNITVRAWHTDGEIRVSVSDTGFGIPAEDQERIFQRFEQGTIGNGRRPDGAGLGLALSKEFVEMHGGQIWVESDVGKGSTFTLSLPVSQEANGG